VKKGGAVVALMVGGLLLAATTFGKRRSSGAAAPAPGPTMPTPPAPPVPPAPPAPPPAPPPLPVVLPPLVPGGLTLPTTEAQLPFMPASFVLEAMARGDEQVGSIEPADPSVVYPVPPRPGAAAPAELLTYVRADLAPLVSRPRYRAAPTAPEYVRFWVSAGDFPAPTSKG
jgi:hypothetical protein